jgi:hypothetical protein
MKQDLKPLIRQYIALVGSVYPGRIPFKNPNYKQACELHDRIREIELAQQTQPHYVHTPWQQHLDSVKETAE